MLLGNAYSLMFWRQRHAESIPERPTPGETIEINAKEATSIHGNNRTIFSTVELFH